MAHSN